MSKQVEENKATFIKTWGQNGSDDGQFDGPHDVAVASDGTIIVVDHGNHRIQCFNCKGNFIRKWGRLGSDDGEFSFPSGLAIGMFSKHKNDINESIIFAMLKVPELSSYPWKAFKDPLSGLLSICASYIGIEHIYVTDLSNNRIQVFGMDGSFIRKWGSWGNGDGQFSGPSSCGIGPHDGMVYVSDLMNHRIQVFDSEGKFIRKWGRRGYGENEFNYPRGLSVSRDVSGSGSQMIYIADTNNDRVVCYHSDGTLAREWAPPSGLCSEPFNVMVDDDRMVYVADSGNHCIRQFRLDGTLIQIWGSEGSGEGQLQDPLGMAKGVDGIMYVADSENNRVVMIEIQS